MAVEMGEEEEEEAREIEFLKEVSIEGLKFNLLERNLDLRVEEEMGGKETFGIVLREARPSIVEQNFSSFENENPASVKQIVL